MIAKRVTRALAMITLVGALVGASCRKPAERAARESPPASNTADPGTGSAAPTGSAAASPTASSPSGSSMQPTLSVKLLASPTQLTMAQRSKFMVGVEVVNRGSAPVDPQLSTRCALMVNGEPSMAWNLAIGNGARDASWTMLPPGKTATMSWPLGEDLFDKPGDYHLVMTLAGQQSTADIHVTR
jgi:hypothetical protein